MAISKNERIKWEDRLCIYQAAAEVLNTKIRLVKMEYDCLAHGNNYSEIQMITSRIKTTESIANKLEKNGLEFSVDNIESRIHDVVGARIICLTLTDAKVFIELLTNSLNKTEGFNLEKCKDYITNPKESGYQSYHFRITVPVTFSNETYNVPAEIQVRTLLMHAWAELEHKMGYKPSEELVSRNLIRAQFNALAANIEATDTLVDNLSGSKVVVGSKVKKICK